MKVYQGGLTQEMMNQVVEQEGQRVLTTAQLAEAYGTDKQLIINNFNRNKNRYTEGKHYLSLEGTDKNNFIDLHQIDLGSKRSKTLYLWTEKGALLHAKSLNTDKAWQAYEMLVDEYYRMKDAVPKSSTVINSHSKPVESFEMQLLGAKYAAEMLRVDETSKIKMLEAAHKQHGVATNHLPSYVEEEVTKSLTSLLKEHGVTMAPAKVNTKLIEAGLLEIRERPSTKGGVKEFKSLTTKGLQYGKNLINPRSPKETQPHYFESKFANLLDLIGLSYKLPA